MTSPVKPITPNSDEQQLQYWEQHLKDALFNLTFPLDKKRPVKRTWQTANTFFTLDAETVTRAEALAEANKTTIEDIFLTIWSVFVYRYSNVEDFLIGYSDISNMIPLRFRFKEIPAFETHLKTVTEERNSALDHEVSWEMLVADYLDLMEDMTIAPLAQIGFAYTASKHETSETDQLDLHLHLWRDGDTVQGSLQHATELYDDETPERMIGHFKMLLAGALDQPETAISHLPILTDAEKQMMMIDWNNNPKEFDKIVPVYRLFEDWVEKQPDAIAAIFEDEQLTYDEFNKQANRLARFLIDSGVGPDKIVAILGDRNIDYMTAMVATHKAGGAFLPFDPKHPAGRIAGILDQSDAVVVLYNGDFGGVANEALTMMENETKPVVAKIADGIAHSDDGSNIPQRCGMRDLAYVMFTSGSTGKPKGVMVEHLGMLNHNHAKVDDLNMGSEDILAQNGPQSFDIMVWQFIAPLMIGGTTHIINDDISKDPARLLHYVDEQKITVLQLVPILLEAMVQEAARLGDERPKLEALKWVVPTGDALPTQLCRDWLAQYPQIPLMNTYGSTECSDDQCHYPVPTVEPDYRLPIMTVGKCIYNTQVYILDKWLQPVPIGVTGEIYVGGIGVGRGYLKDPERTAKAFQPDPFTTDRDDAMLYKMGDQGRFMPDGTIEFLGRVDFMVKVRGFRIELGEIEAALSKHDAVRQRIVKVYEDEHDNKHLVAYVTFHEGQQPTPDDIREHLRNLLPEYMVPPFIMTMDELPVNSNGKVDRKQLPPPDVNVGRGEIVEANTDIEKYLVNVWEEVLHIKPIGIRDNFFELGGHSMLAMRIFANIRREYNIELPLATLFNAPTIEELAHYIDPSSDAAQLREKLHSVVVPIQPKGSRPPFFCVGGGVLNMSQLASKLGKDQPFYALQWQSMDVKKIMHGSVEEAAATFIEGMKTIQPEGPYYIGGSFAAGMIAVEMARQLEAAGEEVAMLAGFDAITGTGGNNLTGNNEETAKKPKRTRKERIIRLLKGGPALIWERVMDYDYEEAVKHFIWKMMMKVYTKLDKPVPTWMRTGIFEEFFILRANEEHKPEDTYKGTFDLFLTPDRYKLMSEHKNWSWGGMVEGQIRVAQTPGDPCTIMLDPNVDQLASQLRARLDELHNTREAV